MYVYIYIYIHIGDWYRLGSQSPCATRGAFFATIRVRRFIVVVAIVVVVVVEVKTIGKVILFLEVSLFSWMARGLCRC